MPPKQSDKSANAKKAAQKAADMTFGLKNKKSAKVQKYVANVQSQMANAGKSQAQRKKEEEEKAARAQKKQEEEKRKTELDQLFKVAIVQPKVPFGTDPKSVLCAFFKANQCLKGDKCKYSHDLNIERKSAKIDLYTDTRAAPGTANAEEGKINKPLSFNDLETMENWDQNKLEQVVKQRHAATTTDIVCKYFLEAIETRKYGYFWVCPNGGDKCKYRHALPPGFVLKSEKKQEEKEEITLEEFLEVERHKLGPNLTPITFETFNAWKEARQARLAAEEASAKSAREKDIRSGKLISASGRDLFTFQPELFADDDEADDDIDYAHREDDDETAEEQAYRLERERLQFQEETLDSVHAGEKHERDADDDDEEEGDHAVRRLHTAVSNMSLDLEEAE